MVVVEQGALDLVDLKLPSIHSCVWAVEDVSQLKALTLNLPSGLKQV